MTLKTQTMLITLKLLADYELTTKQSRNVSSNVERVDNFGDCRDYTGRTIPQSKHYVPAGDDICKLCICSFGKPKAKM